MSCALNRYRTLGRDPKAGWPLRTYGEVHQYRLGFYWTRAVKVPVRDLIACLDAKVHTTRDRLADVVRAHEQRIELPPIEVSVFQSGSAWLVDGNHRLQGAIDSGAPTILTRFTFVGQEKPLRRRKATADSSSSRRSLSTPFGRRLERP